MKTTNNVPVSMNITTDLNAIAAIIRSHGGVVYWPKKVEPTEVDIENGMKLRALRKSLGEKGLTIAEFADKIHRHPQYVWAIEKGRKRVSLRYSQAVYEAFRVYPNIKFHEVEKENNITPIA